MIRLHRLPHTFVAAVVCTFALGIGAATTLFSFVDAMLLRPLPFPNADRLVRIESLRGGERGPMSALELRDIDRQSSLFDGVASVRGSQYIATENGPPENIPASMASYNLFHVLGVKPLIGTTWPQSYDGTAVFAVVLGYDLWFNRFHADSTLVGRPVLLDSHEYTVLGILPKAFEFPEHVGVYRRVPGGDLSSRNVRMAVGVAKLKPRVTLEQAQRELDALARRMAENFPETNRDVRFVVSPLRDYWTRAARPYLGALAGGVACVLLLACANIAALLLARATARRHDAAIRVALGASGRRLVGAAMAETLLLAGFGGILGLAFAVVAARVLDRYVEWGRLASMHVSLDWRVALFSLAAITVAGCLAGALPALRAASIPPNDALRAGAPGAGRGSIAPLRHLVTMQLVLGIVLVAGARLMATSVSQLRSVDVGIRTDNVLTFKIDPPFSTYGSIAIISTYYRRVLDELRSVPNVLSASTDDAPPLIGVGPHEGPHKNFITVEGETPRARSTRPFVNLHMVSPEYFSAAGMRLVAGREIAPGDSDVWKPVAVVTQHLASLLWPGQSPLGRRIQLGALDANYNIGTAATDSVARWATVVGVASDVRENVADPGVAGDLFVSFLQYYTPETYVLVHTRADPTEALRALKAAVLRVDPNMGVFDVRSMRQRVDDSIWQRRLAALLSAAFGVLALSLAVVGVYGVTSFTAARRRGEFAVRSALGASGPAITRLVLRENLRGIAVAIAIAVLVLLATSRLLSGLLYGVHGFDPSSVIMAIAILTVAALAASLIPALRSSRVHPIESLRGG